MRILAFSDLHRDQSTARKIVAASGGADIVVGAGDFATESEGIIDTIEILCLIKTPTVLVSGNHDNLDGLRSACQDWEAANVLHGEQATISGVTFFGLGMEIPQRAQFNWNSHMSENDAELALSKCPDGAVLVTHSPPFGGACDLQTSGNHEGSKSIKTAIESKLPQLSLCGHIHHSWGTEDVIKGCRIANLGPSLNWFEI